MILPVQSLRIFIIALFLAAPMQVSANVCNDILSGSHAAPQSNSVEDARQRAEKILSLVGKGVREEKLTSHPDQQDIIYVYGIPDQIKSVPHQGSTVFRHYSADHAQAIVDSKVLKVGPRPYIRPESHARREYQDLSGIMFSTPDFSPDRLWMGIDEQTDWVEFTLDTDIPVLLCSEGNYLIPTQRNYPDWIRQAYEKYRETGTVSYASLKAEFLRLDAEGGLRPQAEIPIRVLRYQKNGQIINVQ